MNQTPNVGSDTDNDEESVTIDFQAQQLFLFELVQHSLDQSIRTPEAFLDAFPPLVLMGTLDKLRKMRGKFLNAVGATNRRITRRVGTEYAAETLQIVHEDNIKTPAEIVKELPLRHVIAGLDPACVWKFFADDMLKQPLHKIINAIKQVLTRATQHELLTSEVLLRHLPMEEVHAGLSAEDQVRLLNLARNQTLGSGSLPAKAWFDIMSLSQLVQNTDPKALWEQVVIPLARGWGFFLTPEEQVVMQQMTARPAETSLQPVPSMAFPTAVPPSRSASLPPPRPSSRPAASAPVAPDKTGSTEEVVAIEYPDVFVSDPDDNNGVTDPSLQDVNAQLAHVSSLPSSVAPGSFGQHPEGPELIDTGEGHLHLSSR